MMIAVADESPLRGREEVVQDAVLTARTVLRLNRNRTWSCAVNLITDDGALALQELRTLAVPDLWVRRAAFATSSPTAGYLGYQWRYANTSVIWLCPDRGEVSTVRTLAHEVAHALTLGAHGRTWRRAYLGILPIFYDRLLGSTFNVENVRSGLHSEVWETVGRYGARLPHSERLREYRSAVRFQDRVIAAWGTGALPSCGRRPDE